MAAPGDKLNLSPETSRALGNAIGDLLDQLEQDHAEWLSSVPTWWKWYNAEPLSARRTVPWPGASNVVVPIIRTAADAITARVWEQMHSPRKTWLIESLDEDELKQSTAQSIEEFINAESRSTFDVLVPTYDWAQEWAVVGRSTLKVCYSQRYSYRWSGRGRKATKILVQRSPLVRHVPAEQVLWERDRTIADSSVLAEQGYYTWADMLAKVHSDEWDAEAVNDCQGAEGIDGPQGEILATKRRTEGQRPQGGYQESHDIREVWLDYNLAQLLAKRQMASTPPEFTTDDGPQVPIVVTLHRRAKRVLRTMAHPYYFWRWPYLDIYFRKMAGRGGSQGVAKILEHNQRAVTTMVNQSIDAVTLANSLKFATSDPQLKNYQFKPNQPIFVDNISNLTPLNVGAQVIPDIQLINLLVATGERVIGISDPNLGRETRMGGHPSPATNTLVQLSEGAKTLNAAMQHIRQQLSTAGEWILNLYQQYDLDDDSALAERLGPEDAERVRDIITSPDTFHFDLHAVGEGFSQDQERQANMANMQMTANYYGFVLRMLSLIENPAITPGTKEGAIQAIENYTKSYKRFLEASDIDDAEKFAFNMRNSRYDDLAAIQQYGDRLAAQQQAAGAPGAAGAGAPGVQQRPMGPAAGAPGAVPPGGPAEAGPVQ